MKLVDEKSDLFEQIDQEFQGQDIYGLQYVINDLFLGSRVLHEPDRSTDWYGLNDLILD
jgi:hypothetical protein